MLSEPGKRGGLGFRVRNPERKRGGGGGGGGGNNPRERMPQVPSPQSEDAGCDRQRRVWVLGVFGFFGFFGFRV